MAKKPQFTLEPEIRLEPCKYSFSDEEKRGFGDALAREVVELVRVENDKAEASKSYGSQIETHRNRIKELSGKMTRGYEMRDIECKVLLSTPRPGVKSIVRTDTGEVVREEAMTDTDRQSRLDLEAGGMDKKPQ